MPCERRRIYFSGRVQGVGFRFLSEHLAQRFEVAGSVRNLDDGRVELLAEGEPEEISAFLTAIQGELGDKIRRIDQDNEPPGDPPLTGFVVRY